MSLASNAALFLADLALGAWFGAMAFFSFVAAPTAFDVLGSDDAGPVVNAIFPTYYQVGIGLGFVALGGVAVTDALAGLTYYWIAFAATAVAIVAAAYARYRLIPKMEAASDDAFAQHHKQSVALNALAMLSVLVALGATHA